eukprot:Skav235268  [mRNA]  locus=scaffold874:186776:187069:- [translate_table: standard]
MERLGYVRMVFWEHQPEDGNGFLATSPCICQASPIHIGFSQYQQIVSNNLVVSTPRLPDTCNAIQQHCFSFLELPKASVQAGKDTCCLAIQVTRFTT